MDTYTILGLLLILMFFLLGWWACYQYHAVRQLKKRIKEKQKYIDDWLKPKGYEPANNIFCSG